MPSDTLKRYLTELVAQDSVPDDAYCRIRRVDVSEADDA